MTLLIVGHPFHFEMENLCRVFFPADEIRRVTPAESARDRLVWRIRTNRLRMNRQRASPWALTRHRAEKDGWVLEAACGRQGRCWRAKRNLPPGTDRNARELALARLLFAVFRRATSYCPPWGLLTGVRPSKLMLQLRADGGGAAAARYFRESLWVSEEKTALAARVAAAEEPVLALTRPETCSLYVAIPFCPSRCSYCSFVSHTVERSSAARLVPEYLEKLREELLRTAEIVRILGLRVASVYVGGGTPTILTAVQLANLCETLRTAFNWGDCGEFTVEAGRPDTITAEKLTVLKEAGVTRVSVNPQSLDDEVLRLAGRRHTAADALAALRLVREAGFREINMDLIAGLPGDSPAGFRRSLEGVRACAPENITVHTLARKRAAALTRGETAQDAAADTSAMLAAAAELLPAAGYAPYYMYRQSRSVGNLENIGWSLPGRLCRYNIDMMEESHTVLACGAGAVTKLKQPTGTTLERVFNFKYPYEYNARFLELLARKERIISFYSSYSNSGGQR